MTNSDILDQLRFRRARIGELRSLQTEADTITLLNAEEWYVDAQIEYRERHGRAPKLIYPKEVAA